MAVPYTFAGATSAIPLSQLDTNFATTFTLGNTAIQLGNTVTTLNNMTLANVTISSGNVTITNVSVTTANVTTGNITTLTSTNATITNMSSGNVTITGGTINGTTLGATTASSANVTTLTTSSTVTLNGGTANGVLYLNGSKVATSGTALAFDGNRLTVSSATPSIRLDDTNATGAFGIDWYFSGLALQRGNISLDGSTGEMQFQSGASGSAGYFQTFLLNGSEQMRLTSSGLEVKQSQLIGYSSYTGIGTNGLAVAGNVGIGTSSPSEKLTVVGNALVTPTGGWTTGGVATQYFGDVYGSIKYDYNTTNFLISSYGSFSIATNGTSPTTRLTLDSSGNLGLGVTPSAWSASAKALQITNYGAALSSFGGGATWSSLTHNAWFDGTNWKYTASSVGAALYQTTGSNAGSTHSWSVAAGGTAGNNISFTQAATLFSTGNWAVGYTNDNGYRITAARAAGGTQLAVTTAAANGSTASPLNIDIDFLGYADSPRARIRAQDASANTGDSPLTFWTQGTGGFLERARITSGGDFYVGTTNALTAAGRISVAFDQASAYGLILRNTNATATSIFVSFENSTGGSNGNISQTNSTTVAYNTSSDRRLKKDIMPAPQAGADIDAIEVVSHGWVSNNDTVKYGVVAQDLQAVAPQAVSAGDDGEEIERTWGVDYSKLVPMLIKEIQSLRARVVALETK